MTTICFRPDQPLHGTIFGAPSAASCGPDHTSVFVRGGGDVLWHRVRMGGEDAPWREWESHGGALRSRPAAASWGPGRIDVVFVTEGGRIGQNFFVGGEWHHGIDLGAPGSGAAELGPAAVAWGPDRLDVFVPGRDGHLWHRAYDLGAWSGWLDLGAPPWGPLGSALVATSWGPGRIDLFTRGADGALWHRWYDDCRWFEWESLGGGLTSDPAAMVRGPGLIDVYVAGTGPGTIWLRRFDGGWRTWENLEVPGSTDLCVAARTGTPGSFSMFLRNLADSSLMTRVGGDSSRFDRTPGVLDRFSQGLLAAVQVGIGAEARGAGACSWGSGPIHVFAVTADGRLRHTDPGWGTWEDLGKPACGLTSRPGAVCWGPDRIDVFARGADLALWHICYQAGWSAWESLGGGLTSAPAVAAWAPGRLDVFVRGTDNALWHILYEGGWSGWETLGGDLRSAPAVAAWGPGRLDVFVQGSDNTMCQRHWDGSEWSPWGSLGGIIAGAPAVVAPGRGMLDVFVRSPGGSVYRKHYMIGVGWTYWTPSGGIVDSELAAVSRGSDRLDLFAASLGGAIVHLGGRVDVADRLVAEWLPALPGNEPMAACSWAAGRLDVFTVDAAQNLRTAWFDGAWHGWTDLGQPPGGVTSRPAAVCWGPGRIEVFARGGDNALWQRSFDNGWHPWQTLGGGLTSAPSVTIWGPERLDVFVRGTDQGLWHRWWHGTAWSDWESLGGTLSSAPAVASWGAGRLDVFVRGTDNSLCQRYYDGSWSGWVYLGGDIRDTPAVVAPRPGQLDIYAVGAAGTMMRRRHAQNQWSAWFDVSLPLDREVAAVAWSPGHLDLFKTGADGARIRLQAQEDVTPAGPVAARVGDDPSGPLTQVQFSFGLDDTGQGPGALAWLAGDVFGVGKAALVQPWNNSGHLGMNVYQGDERGALQCAFASADMGHGSGNIGFLIGDIDHDGRDEIVQLWDNGGALGMIVYGSPQGVRTLQVRQSIEDMGQGSHNIGWLIGDVDGDGRKEIIQLWNRNGRLAILGYGPDGSGRMTTKLRMDDTGHGPGTITHFMMADVNGDGRAEIVHLWDGGGLSINVYGWDGGQFMPALSSTRNLGQGIGHIGFLLGDINGDGRAELVQLWDDNGRLGIIVYGFDTGAVPRVLWQGTHPEHGSRALRWLIGDLNGDGRAEIVQLWPGGDSDNPALGMNVWVGSPNGALSLAFTSSNMGQGPNALGWLIADFNGDRRAEVLQLWENRNDVIDRSALGLLTYKARYRAVPRLSDAEKLQMMTDHAPRVWLYPDELYMPSSVEWAFPHLERRPYADGSGYWLQTKEPLDHPTDNSLALFRGDVDTAPVYAFWVSKGDVVDIVYFFFYPYNRGKEVGGTVYGNHVGDWEHITLRLTWVVNAQNVWQLVPLQMCVSAHDFQNTVDWETVPKVPGTRHPIIYSAEGSHGCWLGSGQHIYKRGIVTLADDCAEGLAWETWQRLRGFDYAGRTELNGQGWPAWMGNDYPAAGSGDPAVPGQGPIYRWGNEEQGPVVFGQRQLEWGPTGPIGKNVWGTDSFG